jgi:hypothetical protein
MDTLSFALGIAFVVVIAIAIVAVYAFVKVREIKTQLNHVEHDVSHNMNEVYRYITERHEDIIRTLDSRLDKLETKLTIKK